MTPESEAEPLWQPSEQADRLNELMSDDAAVKENPLRRDVRLLGRLLGEVLKEQEGLPLYELVEELRQLAIRERDSQTGEGQVEFAADDERQLVKGAERINSLSI